VLSHVVGVLACPHCGAGCALDGQTLRCAAGHAFDVAKQGYVSLLPGDAKTGTADTAEMVEARDAFLGGGHYAGLAGALGAAVGGADVIADVGAGTGYYLARILDERPASVGVALDVSKFALRRAARAHERIGAVVADVWHGLPIRDSSVDVAMNVFAPRNAAELRRILRPDGALVVVTPTTGHLAELVTRLGLLSVDPDKADRLSDQLGSQFRLESALAHEETLRLGPADVRALVLMGPSAFHLDRGAVDTAVAELPDPFEVTISTTVSTFRPAVRFPG
jgi:23S rRNA (guanine745-N1)-methyltransferase